MSALATSPLRRAPSRSRRRSLGAVALAALSLFFAELAAVATARAETAVLGGGPVFDVVGPEAGLDFVHFNGMTGKLLFAEMFAPGAALFDYDNDGDLDLYLVQGTKLGPEDKVAAEVPGDRLYRNDLVVNASGEHRLRFTNVTRESGIRSRDYGMGVAAGDFNNDGWTDLYVTNFGPNRLLLNGADGRFRDATTGSGAEESRWSVSAIASDFDADGLLDLFVGNYVDFRLENQKACHTVTGARDYCGPLAYKPIPDRLLRGRGDGTFEDVTAKLGLAKEFGGALGVIDGDFNGDGRLDLYVANDGTPNQMWIQGTDGRFENQALLAGTAVNSQGASEAGMGVDAGDYDGDGDEDLIVAHLYRETHTLYRNQGGGLFHDATAASGLGPASWDATGFAATWIDIDSDGLLDLFVANGAVKLKEDLVRKKDPYPIHEPNQLFHNLGGGRFRDVSAQGGPGITASEVSRGAAAGDVDNDGDMDLLVLNNSGPARLLLNRSARPGHWLGLELKAPSGRAGGPGSSMIGAWVRVRQPGRPDLWRRSRTGGGYASARDPRVLFGLGAEASPVMVHVLWPDGAKEEWEVAEIDRYVTLLRGTGKPPSPHPR